MISDTPLQLLLRRLELHGSLDDEDRRAVLALPHTVREIEANGYIAREGDRPERIGILVSGYVMAHKITGAGARQVVALHIAGDPIDFQHFYLDCLDHNLQAINRAVVAFVPRDAIQGLAEFRPAVGRAILLDTLIQASVYREWITNMGRRSAQARIAHFLCELAVRLEAQGLMYRDGYCLPMSQEQLADAVGLTPVHVNRTLKGLEAAGLILRHKRRFAIPDWDMLREAGDFRERYLHREVERSAPRLTKELT